MVFETEHGSFRQRTNMITEALFQALRPDLRMALDFISSKSFRFCIAMVARCVHSCAVGSRLPPGGAWWLRLSYTFSFIVTAITSKTTIGCSTCSSKGSTIWPSLTQLGVKAAAWISPLCGSPLHATCARYAAWICRGYALSIRLPHRFQAGAIHDNVQRSLTFFGKATFILFARRDSVWWSAQIIGSPAAQKPER